MRSGLTCALALASTASAQDLTFQETFEQGLAGWTITSSGAAGRDDTCSFNDGFFLAAETEMTLDTPIDLPAGQADLFLSFWSFEDVECAECECECECECDKREIFISADGAPFVLLGENDRRGQWWQTGYDLTQFAGQSVLLRFRFTAMGDVQNDGLGWGSRHGRAAGALH